MIGALQCVAVCCSVLQCAEVCCSVLQCAAACCSVLQCVAACCNVLQCVAVCCSVLQRVAACCSENHFRSASSSADRISPINVNLKSLPSRPIRDLEQSYFLDNIWRETTQDALFWQTSTRKKPKRMKPKKHLLQLDEGLRTTADLLQLLLVCVRCACVCVKETERTRACVCERERKKVCGCLVES